MAPVQQAEALSLPLHSLVRRNATFDGHWRDKATPESLILESWSQGFMVGALLMMACVTAANMRRGVILHKLIMLELLLAMSHGTFCFMDFNGYGWYLSSTASLLYTSWVIHNLVDWIKVRPFFIGKGAFFGERTGIWVQRFYLITLAMTIPPIILQIYDNFRFFNNINDFYIRVRPYEPLLRDPWWIFTNIVFIHVIRKSYVISVFDLVRQSPRLGILLAAMCLANIFTIMDILASVLTGKISTVDGINPYWKLSLVFKCLTDTIMLDDFRTALKKLGFARLERDEKHRKSIVVMTPDDDMYNEDYSMSSAAAVHHDDIEDVGPRTHQSPDQMDLGEMLTDDAQLDAIRTTAAANQANGSQQPRRKSSGGATKYALGKMGIKVSKLPRLGKGDPHSNGWSGSREKEALQ